MIAAVDPLVKLCKEKFGYNEEEKKTDISK